VGVSVGTDVAEAVVTGGASVFDASVVVTSESAMLFGRVCVFPGE
jgi:hypothetical protein